MNRRGAIVKVIEAKMCFLSRPGSASSLLPVIKPAPTNAIHSPRNVSGKRRARPLSAIVGQVLSPKTKSHRKPAVVPVMAVAAISERSAPGARKSKQYMYLFFIKTPDSVNRLQLQNVLISIF